MSQVTRTKWWFEKNYAADPGYTTLTFPFPSPQDKITIVIRVKLLVELFSDKVKSLGWPRATLRKRCFEYSRPYEWGLRILNSRLYGGRKIPEGGTTLRWVYIQKF